MPSLICSPTIGEGAPGQPTSSASGDGRKGEAEKLGLSSAEGKQDRGKSPLCPTYSIPVNLIPTHTVVPFCHTGVGEVGEGLELPSIHEIKATVVGENERETAEGLGDGLVTVPIMFMAGADGGRGGGDWGGRGRRGVGKQGVWRGRGREGGRLGTTGEESIGG
ncbi:hypothetical protein Salat_0217800 [Sesamum alatum]|uniref:Uncharacterized protein n=1 Tax=Sesamum alatum TaxID=300844 RepID=A0AAE1YZ87_9LAMI|nr:hypothetical protein Salat_0217800 [Sesamum alatum]